MTRFLGVERRRLRPFDARRGAIGLELSHEYLWVTLQRITSELVRVAISVTCMQFSVDLFGRSVDRSDRTAEMSGQLQLVQQECRFYFIGRHNREVLFIVDASTIEIARETFRSSGRSDSEALFIIKTETEIYLA